MPTDGLDRGVIVADDSALVRENLRAALDPPWRVLLAANGFEAVQLARSMRATLILLDFRMPRVDGIDACEQIRGLPDYATTPIVMLTAYNEDHIRRRALAAGATAVFAKPFTTGKLRAGLAPLLAASTDAMARGAVLRQAKPERERLVAEPDELAIDHAVLSVCREAEASAVPRRYASFVEAAQAFRNASRH